MLLLPGCEPTKPEVDPSAPRVSSSRPDVTGEDILPPQSEPPVNESEPDDTDPAAPSDDPPSDEPTSDEKSTDEKSTGEKSAAAPEEDAPAGKTRVLFAGKNLDDWEFSNFGGEGEVEVKDGTVVFNRGADLTGIHWKGKPLPKINYEVTLEAQRIDGSDFFCGIVFPVNDSFCSFVAGGWGGSTIGLSSVDDIFAAENETGTYASFEDEQWYKFKLRVSDSAITAWIDGKQYVYLKTKNRKFSLHPAMEAAKPFGVAAFSTVAAIRDIKVRELTEDEIAAEAKEAAE